MRTSGFRSAEPRPRQPAAHPAERAFFDPSRRMIPWVAAVVFPVVVAFVLVPWRDDLAQSTATIMMLPVVIVAGWGGLGPALVAAVVASTAFDVALTSPYYKLTIHENDDVVAMIVLLVVGIVVGVFTQLLARSAARSQARLAEMDHLISFAREALEPANHAAVVGAAQRRLMGILGLLECEWRDDQRDVTAPVLLADGHIMGKERDLPVDRGQLPAATRLPVRSMGNEIGYFVLQPTPGHSVSLEERQTAAAIIDLLGHALASSAAS
jgi:K+-sensing histidine kinase KdpD